jgi:hypothetical protein
MLCRRVVRQPRSATDLHMENERTTVSAASPVQGFFDQYVRSRTALDIDLIAAQYPDSFMLAGPAGARVAEKTAVLAAFPKGQEFLKALGHTATTVRSLDETRLDDHYALVRAQFVWRFDKPPTPPRDVAVDSSFILHVDQGVLRIVFQHEHEEFQEALRAQGVLPPGP